MRDLKNLNLDNRFPQFLLPLLYYISQIKKFNDLYCRYKSTMGWKFADRVLEYHNVKLSYDQRKMDVVKSHKSLIVIANHPHGILDGLLLLKLFGENGAENIKVVANPFVESIESLAENLIIVNPFEDSKNSPLSFRGCKSVLTAFKEDNYIVFFPSADVSLFNPKTMKVEDPPWNKTFFKLIEKADRAILPIYINGRNSVLYQIFATIHCKLGFLGLIPEFLKKKRECIHIEIGDPVLMNGICKDDLPFYLRKKVTDLRK